MIQKGSATQFLLRFLPLALLSSLLATGSLQAQERRYDFLPGESTMEVHVPRAGLLKRLGHDHLIRAGSLAGHVEFANGSPVARELRLEVSVASLSVADEEVSEKDRRKIESEMLGDEVLALADWPVIRFSATRIELKDSGEWKVTGILTIRDQSREVSFTSMVSYPANGQLLAVGSLELTPEEFGIQPVSALAGMVRTAEVIEIRFSIAGHKG